MELFFVSILFALKTKKPARPKANRLCDALKLLRNESDVTANHDTDRSGQIQTGKREDAYRLTAGSSFTALLRHCARIARMPSTPNQSPITPVITMRGASS